MRDVPKLKHLREGQGWSQRTLAAKSGIAQNTISQLERGERQAMPSTVHKLAEALGVEPSVLLAESWTDRFVPRGLMPSEDPELQQKLEKEDRELRQDLERLMRLKVGLDQEIETLTRERAAGSRRREAPRDQEPQWSRLHGPLLPLLLERETEEAPVRKEWYEAGRWAEYYVSGELINRAIAFAEANKARTDSEERFLKYFPAYAEQQYLHDTIFALRSPHTGDLVAVMSQLISNDPQESLRAAQIVLRWAKRIVEEYDSYLQSFRRIPERYYADPAAQARIQELQEALSDQRAEAAEAVQVLLDLYDESLGTLEAQLIEMREEGNTLQQFVTQSYDWKW